MAANPNPLDAFSILGPDDLSMSAEPNSLFPYQSLNAFRQEVRLVNILPHSTPNDIRCQTCVTELGRAGPFTALSYTWGSPSFPCKSIQLDGKSFKIRENLWRFLQNAIGQLSVPTKLWIDAICINQNDHRERSTQVGLMGDIYSMAERVLVWLGPTYHRSDEVMRTLQTSHQPRHFKRWLERCGDDVLSFCTRAYWGRLWTFQELVLAKKIDIMCGSMVATEQSLRELFTRIQNMSARPRSQGKLVLQHLGDSAAMLNIELRKQYEQGPASLWELLEKTNHLQCRDRRDRVFALLAVATLERSDIKPDYDMSLSLLLNQVLRAHQLETDIASYYEVEVQCSELARLFEIDLTELFALTGQDGCTLKPANRDIDCLREHTRIEPGTLFPPGLITLWWSVRFDHGKVTALLLEKYVAKDIALFKAANLGLTPTADVLLRAGVNANACVKGKKTALHCASQAGHSEVVQLLLKMPQIRLDLEDDKGETPVHLAAKNGHLSVLDALLKKSTSSGMNAPNRDGQTPLHLAAQQGRYDVVQALLSKSTAGIDLPDRNGQTALHLAAFKGSQGVVTSLLIQNAAILATDNEGRTALDFAESEGHERVMRMITQRATG